MYQKPLTLVIAMVLTSMLASCSINPEPSSDEVRVAYEKYLKRQAEDILSPNSMGGLLIKAMGGDQIELHRAEKIGCKDTTRTSATCEIFVEMTIGKADNAMGALLGLGGKKSGIETHRLIRTSAGWMIAGM